MKKKVLKLIGGLMIFATLTIVVATGYSAGDPPGIGMETKIEQLA